MKLQSIRMRGNSSSEHVETSAANAVRAAREFVDRRFPDCVAALLFGSGARNDPTASSDLDILIIESRRVAPYHLHFQETDWRFDVMGRSLRFCTKRLRGRGQPSRYRDDVQILLIACAEGIELKDVRDVTREFKQRASLILEKGPPALSAHEISNYRLQITEALDDFVDAKNHTEASFVAYGAVIVTSQFLREYNRQWSDGDCKWVYRRLRNDNHPLARELLAGLDRYRRTDDRAQLSRSIESILDLVGGRLYQDDVSGNTIRRPTRAEQFLQHPIDFTRKAVRRIAGDL